MSEWDARYPFQVCLWIEGNGEMRSLFDRGWWVEYARCGNQERAEEVARCLALRLGVRVRVAELVGAGQQARFVPYGWL